MNYLFTSESVSEGHPDKVADQISDAILDKLLAYDPSSKVACETLVTTGQVVIAGEVKSKVYIDIMDTARRVINRIGYTKSEYKFDGESCGILTAIHEQSGDINRADDPVASPSSPSVRLAPFDTAATTKIVTSMNRIHPAVSACSPAHWVNHA